MKNLDTLTFASQELKANTMLLREFLNDGGKYATATIFANTTQAFIPKKDGSPYGAKDIRKDAEYGISLNGNYAKNVQKRLAEQFDYQIENGLIPTDSKLENFKAKKNWHVKIFDSANGSIVCKRSELENNLPITAVYLLVVNNYTKNNAYYLQGAKVTDKATLENIAKYRKDRAKETAKSQGLTDKKKALIVSTIAFENISQINANKKKLFVF